MYPLISIKKGQKNFGRFFLDNKRHGLTVGASPQCDLTTFEQQKIDHLPLLNFSDNRLQVVWEADLPLQLTVDEQSLDLKTIVNLGLAKQKGNRLTITLKPHPETYGQISIGEFDIEWRFDEKPTEEMIRLPKSLYFTDALKQFDWRFVAILALTLIGTFWFGNFLYGLPAPHPAEKTTNEVTFRFSRIVVPKEALTGPTNTEASGINASGSGAAGSASGSPKSSGANSPMLGGRELLNKKIDSLLSRLDSSMNLTTDGKNLTGKVGNGKTRTLSDLALLGGGDGSGSGTNGDGLSADQALKVRNLYNYESAPVIHEKKIANLDTTKITTTNSPQNDGFDRNQANIVIRNAYGRIRGCYEEALKADRSLNGKATRLRLDNRDAEALPHADVGQHVKEIGRAHV